MKVVARPIDMVCWIDREGHINPVRFRMDAENSELITIKIGRIIGRSKEKLAGNPMMIFDCQGVINGIERPFQLKYELSTCKWMLFKI